MSRSSDVSAAANSETKTVTNKTQTAWRTLSPTRPSGANDPTPQESISNRSQVKVNDTNDRHQSTITERKQRYTTNSTTTATINTASIPPLMSVRSDIPPTPMTLPPNAAMSKHYKTSNQSQRQDYNRYFQRNDFYNENNDSTWGNDDEYYDDETGYYDSNIQTNLRHHRHSMGYHSTLHRGYIALGFYGRYRRGGTLRHQQQHNIYNVHSTSNSSSQHNSSAGSKTKKNRTIATTADSKKSDEQTKTTDKSTNAVSNKTMNKSSVWTTETTTPPTVEEVPIVKSIETSANEAAIEKTKDSTSVLLEQKHECQSNIVEPTETESTVTNRKITASKMQRKTNKDQHNYHHEQHYQYQQATRYRNAYVRSMQGNF